MKTIPLSSSLSEVSTLVYGCMGFGGGWGPEPVTKKHVLAAHDAVEQALLSGINIFDHADIYTLGKAELTFGQVLKERPELREKIYLQSKCSIRFEDSQGPGRYDMSKDWITSSVEGTLKRLNVEYLDMLLLHRPDPLMAADEVAEALHQLKAAGKVRHFGVSNMHSHQMNFLQSALDQPLVANQIEMSLSQLDWLEQGVLAGNPQGKDVNFDPALLDYCRKNNVQLQAWGSLCGGLFTGVDTANKPAHVQQTAALVTTLSQHYNVSKEAIVIAWLAMHPANIQPIIGTTDVARIKNCGEGAKLTLSREHWYALYVSSRGQALP
ncbi:MAG: aldo/keto reductase [Gammaproteobacteria bacterium]|nr:aldo/keto reductase [Gammaproteobacteria bacterium]